MGLVLEEKQEEFPTYNDDRVFNWQDFGYYLILENFTVMNRSGDFWEVFYKDDKTDQRLSYGSKEFCMKTVEHEIRINE